MAMELFPSTLYQQPEAMRVSLSRSMRTTPIISAPVRHLLLSTSISMCTHLTQDRPEHSVKPNITHGIAHPFGYYTQAYHSELRFASDGDVYFFETANASLAAQRSTDHGMTFTEIYGTWDPQGSWDEIPMCA